MKTVKYVVYSVDWAVEDYPPKPSSSELDDRTIREHTFLTSDEALKYAEAFFKGSDEWLAKLEVRVCVTETIKKYK